MPPLDGAITLAESDHGAVIVAENLYFDVARMREIFFDEYPPVAECRRGFARGRFQRALELRGFRHHAHPASASACRSLDHKRVAHERRKLARRGNFRGFDSRHDRNSGCDCDSPRRDFVAERRHHLRPRSDKHDLRIGRGLRELGTLGEKSVARMNRVGAGLLCGGDYRRDVEVALCGLGGSDRNCLVSRADVCAFRVRRRIDSHGFQAEQARTADDPKRNFAAIGDQQFCEPAFHRFVEKN